MHLAIQVNPVHGRLQIGDLILEQLGIEVLEDAVPMNGVGNVVTVEALVRPIQILRHARDDAVVGGVEKMGVDVLGEGHGHVMVR